MPEFSQATASFLLKAEARTVSAALHAKSTAQLRQVMQAAMKRADIQAQKDKDNPTETTNATDIKNAQVLIVNQLTALNEAMATKTDLNELYQHIQVQHMMIMQQLQVITARLQYPHHDETNQHHAQHMTPIAAPKSLRAATRQESPSPSLTPTVVASQPASHEGEQATQEHQDMALEREQPGQDMSPNRPSLLQQLEAKSHLVQTQKKHRAALQPFASRRD